MKGFISIIKIDRISIKIKSFSIKNLRISFENQFKLKDPLRNSIHMKGFIIIIKDERISFKNQFESKDSLWNSIQIKGFIIIGFIIIIKK